MRPYGLPRTHGVEHSDVDDIKTFGLKSSVGRIRKKGGDIPSYFHNSERKRRIRRAYKKKARNDARAAIAQY